MKPPRKLFMFAVETTDSGMALRWAGQFGGAGSKRQKVDDIWKRICGAVHADTGKPIMPLGKPDDWRMFDGDGVDLPKDTLIEQVPIPGIVFFMKNSTQEELDSQLTAYLVRSQLEERDPAFKEFLAGKDAEYEPEPMWTWDVFISYSSLDSQLATELKEDFEQLGIRCYLAGKDIKAGQLWREEIRSALRLSKVAVLLLTPNSISSKWVMCEAGAFWALGKPLLPAAMFVDLEEVPELITEFQCRSIEPVKERSKFVGEVKELCEQ